MSVNEKIIQALNCFGYPVKPDMYTGGTDRYFTFNYADDRGADYGDNRPGCTVCYMQIHFFLPVQENYLSLKKQVRSALFHAGFSFPAVTVLTEKKLRHLIFECEIEESED